MPEVTRGMKRIECRSREEAAAVFGSAAHAERYAFERDLAVRHRDDRQFTIRGTCLVDHEAVDFDVDRQWGAHQLDDGTWMPNWRERLVCPRCGLINRQRAIASAVLEHMGDGRGRSLYLMEQVTALFQVMRDRLPASTCYGSEFLGPQYRSGEIVGAIRHEDAECLSFATASLDGILSSDVFEHVPDPSQAFREAARVLRPGGRMFFTVPFFWDRVPNTSRAELVNGQLRHLLPPEYHGNPVSKDGSLVFTEYGWELLAQVTGAGFSDCVAVLFWSLEYGHLGPNNLYFVATR